MIFKILHLKIQNIFAFEMNKAFLSKTSGCKTQKPKVKQKIYFQYVSKSYYYKQLIIKTIQKKSR